MKSTPLLISMRAVSLSLRRDVRLPSSFGRKKHKIFIHRDILLQVQYFAEKPLAEIKAGDLHEFDFSSFSETAGNWLAHWLYFKKVPYELEGLARSRGAEAADASFEVVEAYLLASHLLMEEWANDLTNAFMKFPFDIPCIDYYDQIYSADDAGRTCELKDLVLTMLAFSIVSMGLDGYLKKVDPNLEQRVRDGGDFSYDLLECMSRVADLTMEGIKEEDKCSFHVHETSKRWLRWIHAVTCSGILETRRRQREATRQRRNMSEKQP